MNSDSEWTQQALSWHFLFLLNETAFPGKPVLLSITIHTDTDTQWVRRLPTSTDRRTFSRACHCGTDTRSCGAAPDTELRVAAAFYSVTPNPPPLAHSGHIIKLWPLITNNSHPRLEEYWWEITHTHTLCLRSLCLLPLSQRFLLPVSLAVLLPQSSPHPLTHRAPRPGSSHGHLRSILAPPGLPAPSPVPSWAWPPSGRLVFPRTAGPGSPHASNPAGSLGSSLTHIRGPPNLTSWRRPCVPRHRPGLTPAPAPPHSTPALAAGRSSAAPSEPGAAPRLSGSSPSPRPRSPAAAAPPLPVAPGAAAAAASGTHTPHRRRFPRRRPRRTRPRRRSPPSPRSPPPLPPPRPPLPPPAASSAPGSCRPRSSRGSAAPLPAAGSGRGGRRSRAGAAPAAAPLLPPARRWRSAAQLPAGRAGRRRDPRHLTRPVTGRRGLRARPGPLPSPAVPLAPQRRRA